MTTPFWLIYLIGLVVIVGMMKLLWLLSLRLKNSSIVDIFWGTGFVVASWLYFFLTPGGASVHRLLLNLLVTVWGLRLSAHIFRRNWGKDEDFRYRKWREESGAAWTWQSLFRVFLLQGALLWVISAPLLAAQYTDVQGLPALDILGAAVWAIGFYFEAAGDNQLARFRSRPENRGKLLDSGVWRFTRHPNYFGDAAQWWGFFLFAAAAGAWWTVFSPLLMTFLLLRVSGVSLLERTMETRPGYREYQARTSAFFPWVKKK